MGGAAWLSLGLAGVFAVVDWVAVATGRKRLEYACKPLTILALIGVAVAIHPAVPAQRAWWLAALTLGLVGDVFLMLPREAFIAGLAAFLLGHLAYVAGFWAAGAHLGLVVFWLLVILLPLLVALRWIVRGAHDTGQIAMVGPIVAYSLVIAVMVAFALAGPSRLAAAGAVLFMASDGLVGFRRFVSNRPWMGLAIITTYHVGQAALVLSLAR